jgi:Raf kinase inhibitor-like YbhB/YbcL family protein
MGLTLTSEGFADGGEIPAVYTCQGRDISPALAWDNIPKSTQSFALVVHDPDVPSQDNPKRIWVHWVLYNLPPGSKGLPENVTVSRLPAGTREGVNDWKRTGYGGPCPPRGRHRYFHTLYALDIKLKRLKNPTKAQLEQAMKGHVLDRAELIGTYQKG